MSGNDTGATRISDIGRNLLAASTDLKDWTSLPVGERATKNVRKASSKTFARNEESAMLLVPVEFEMAAI